MSRHAILMSNGTVAQEAVLHGLGHRTGRRGHHGLVLVQRDGQRHPAGRRPSGVRRRPRGRLLHGSRPGRGGDHAANQGDHAGPPVRADGGHGPARRDRRAGTASRSSRTRPRRTAPTYRGRRAGPVRAGDVQPVRHEEPDDRRGRLRDDGRRRRSPTGSACSATTACGSATTTRRWGRTSSPRTSRRRSASPSSSASTSAPSSGGGTRRALTAGLGDDYLVPTVPGWSRARVAPVRRCASRASARR